uniref:NR LBD domain-containing protein n=1 Tax=Octopus bimaculoides TaxID=37653 RepID=A0A0L8GPH1_OCTBM
MLIREKEITELIQAQTSEFLTILAADSLLHTDERTFLGKLISMPILSKLLIPEKR